MTNSSFTPRMAFTGAQLDHAEDRRSPEELRVFLKDPKARALILKNGNPAIHDGGALKTCHPQDLVGQDIIAPGPLFLGLDDQGPVFAFALTDGQSFTEASQFQEMRAIASWLDQPSLAIAGRAKSLFDWHYTHRFCSTCGKESQPVGGGMYRRCPSCETDHFPRVNPVAIMLILHEDHCLLGRSPGWPDKAYSALAGFVSPGESMEEGCKREVKEEVGVDVHSVRYVFSQPWPFPSQLMMGLICHADSRDYTVNKKELEDAQWFSKETVAGVFSKSNDAFLRPPGFTIANQLLRYWLSE